MKKLQKITKNYKTVFFFCFVLLITSCKKENSLFEKQKVNSTESINECFPEDEFGYNYSGIEIKYDANNQILKFRNWDDFHNAVELLEKQYEEHNETRESQLPVNVTNEEADALDEEVGFDSYLINRQIEGQFEGFNSKRKVIEDVENEWLYHDMTGQDPDEIDFTFDDAENTFFNYNYEVIIGCYTYRITENGLLNLTNPEETIENQTSSESFYTEDDKCIYNKRNSDVMPGFNSNNRVRLKVALNRFIFRSSAKTKAVNYTINRRGKWRRGRTNIAVHVGGKIFTKKCGDLGLINNRFPAPNGFKKRKEIKIVQRWYHTNISTKKHLLAGMFELSTGQSGQVLIQ